MGKQRPPQDPGLDERTPAEKPAYLTLKYARLRASVKAIVHDTEKLDLLLHASGMAYVTLLSIVPSLAVSFALASLFSSVHERGMLIEEGKRWLLSKLTEGTGVEVTRMLELYIAKLDIKQIGITGLASLLVTLILLLRQIEITLNRIFRAPTNRHILMRFLYFASSLAVGAALVSLVYEMLKAISLKSLSALGTNLALPAAPGAYLSLVEGSMISFVFFFLIFKLVPNVPVKAKAAAIGALFTACLFHLASYCFSLYVTYVANYQVIYGALATLPVFLMWLYVCWLIVLLGGLVTWRAEHGTLI